MFTDDYMKHVLEIRSVNSLEIMKICSKNIQIQKNIYDNKYFLQVFLFLFLSLLRALLILINILRRLVMNVFFISNMRI